MALWQILLIQWVLVGAGAGPVAGSMASLFDI